MVPTTFRCRHPEIFAFWAATVTLGLFAFGLAGEIAAAEQRISLKEGWNAVFLELEPSESSPDRVFGSHPIAQCALWLPTKARVESLVDPAALPNKPSEWLVWHPSSHPAAFLNTLKQVQGRRAMLIKASSATTLIIEGEHLFERRQWIAPSFNLTGFDVDPNEPPTFARFFDGSRAHEELNVFKLIDGTWRKVSAQETMRRGEAYWVWCKEGTGFQGPVDLNISSGNELTIEATSNGALPVTLTVNAADQSTLPLHSIRRRRISVPISSVTDSLLVQGGGMRFSISLPVDPNES